MSNTLADVGTVELDFSKNKVQRDVLACQAPYQNYSGGFGSGKTSLMCLKTQILSSIPNNFGIIARRTYPDLKDSTRKTFFEILRPDWIRYWKESENALTLKNGSGILFRHFENGQIRVGPNIGWFFIDQAEEAEEEIFLALQGRLRRKVPLPGGGFARNFGFLAMNPNGEDWQHRLFIHNKNPRFAHFDSTTFDNQANLRPGYIQDMLDSYPLEWVERFVYGKWNKMSGLIYHEFDESLHVVDPFRIPRSWVKGRGMDWGVDAPATCMFIAQSPNGNYYVFDEYGEREKTPEEHADSILEQSKAHGLFRATVLDSSAWRRDSDLKTVAGKYQSRGLTCLPATKDLLRSILHVKQLLKTNRLFFFRGQTEKLLEEKKKWKWGAKQQGKEVPARGDDHYLDGERYILDWMDRKKFYVAADKEAREHVGGKLTIGNKADECDPVTGLPA